MRFFVAVFCLTALMTHTSAVTAAEPFVEVDFSTIKRSIAKEPKYIAQPRYALFVLDPAGKFQVWAVFDKSKAELPYYDVLYFDRNGNGDLTDLGERFVGKYDKSLAAAGMAMTIRVGKVPGNRSRVEQLIFPANGRLHMLENTLFRRMGPPND